MLLFLLTAIALSGAFSIISSIHAQNQKKKQVEKKEVYTRPTPTKPIKPTIPDVNRFQDDKVFLENADSLYRPSSYDPEEKQIVKGNVKFRQGSMWMFCDSAYYFPEKNSLDAFGHVVMQQGDTLFVYADKLYFDGLEKHAILTDGPSQRNVIMKDPKVTLTTDSLDYDLNQELGWYTRGGKLEDGVNVLTSTYGEYSPATKEARFRDEVVMTNSKDGFRMFTEELDYNTETHIADINTQTRIEGENDTILTTSGEYNTMTDNAVLRARSTIIHRDTSNNIITLEGDSIIYDKAKRTSRAYMFKDVLKKGQPMVLTDTARKVTLIGGFGEYNDSLQRAYSTDYPLLLEYSRPDTLFLRADTILTSIRVEDVWPDSLAHEWSAATRLRLNGYTSLEQVAADLILDLSTLPYKFPMPGTAGLISLTGLGKGNGQPDVPGDDSPVAPPADASVPHLSSSDKKGGGMHSEQPSPKDAKSESGKGEDRKEALENELASGKTGNGSVSETADSVSSPRKHELKTLQGVPDISIPTELENLTPEQKDSLKRIPGLRIDRLGRDSAYMVPKEFHVAKAVGRARFFNQDLQGIADTMIYQEYDSMLFLIRKPVVWSGERQVYGGKINVHFNDSVADWAHLPESGFVAEYIDENFYNQMSGKVLKAYFENNELRHLFVDGNVETIFLPMENDSTYNRLVHAESSFLTIDMEGRKMDRLKMWPSVTGSVTPIYLVKRDQQFLPGFKWFEALRPKREWYGDRWHWIDDLGEIPEELERYFNEAPVMRNSPKSPFAK